MDIVHGIHELRERLKFAKKANALRRKNWTWKAIAERLLGHERYARGAKKLSSAGYMAKIKMLIATQETA